MCNQIYFSPNNDSILISLSKCLYYCTFLPGAEIMYIIFKATFSLVIKILLIDFCICYINFCIISILCNFLLNIYLTTCF